MLAECPLAHRERRRCSLDASGQGDVFRYPFRLHQASASIWSPGRSVSERDSISGAARLFLAACSSSRVKRRRRRSSASGAGLEKTLTVPNSEASPLGLPRLLSLSLSFISLCLIAPVASESALCCHHRRHRSEAYAAGQVLEGWERAVDGTPTSSPPRCQSGRFSPIKSEKPECVAPCPVWEDTRVLLYEEWELGARFGVIPVYRDLLQFPKGKSGAVLNVKQAKKTGSGAGFASTLVNGLVPVQFPKGKRTVLLHQSEQFG